VHHTSPSRTELNSGTSDVRSGLELDVERLDTWMRNNVADYAGPIRLEQFKGGQSNPTYKIITQNNAYVLRRKPPGKLLKSAHSVDQEFRILRGVLCRFWNVPFSGHTPGSSEASCGWHGDQRACSRRRRQRRAHGRCRMEVGSISSLIFASKPQSSAIGVLSDRFSTCQGALPATPSAEFSQRRFVTVCRRIQWSQAICNSQFGRAKIPRASRR
jgi:hypothetical protein